MKSKFFRSLFNPDSVVFLYFLIFILLSGGGPVAMRISFAEMPPFWVSLIRFGFGALIYWIMAAMKKLPVPKGRALAGPLFYGALGFGVSFAFISWGLVKTPASVGAVILALIPMLTVIFSALEGVESLTSRNILGSLLAVFGTAIAVGAASATNEISLIHIGAMIIGAAFMAQGGVMIKRFPANPPVITNAIAMTIGAVVLVATSLISGETWVIPVLPATWAALAYLIVFVSVVGNLAFMEVLNRWTASATSYGFVALPFVTVLISAILTREQITVNFLLGLLLVIGGVIIGALLPNKVSVSEECATC